MNNNKLYKIPNMKGYDLSNYRITKDGRMFGLKYNMFLTPQCSLTGYYYYTININKKTVHFPIHRLVCATFKPVKGWENMHVDHIDGNKKNNAIDNLEFVSCKENVNRYHKGDYRYIKHQVLIRHVLENKIVVFPNIKAASDYLKISPREVMKRIHAYKLGHVFNDYTQIILDDGKSKFINYDDYHEQIQKQLNIKPVVMYNHLTKEKKTFGSIKDACAFLKLSPSSLSFRLNASGIRRVVPSGWEIKYECDKRPWHTMTATERKKFDNLNTIVTPLKVTNILTNEVLKFNSIKEAAKYYKCTPTKIWYRLNINKDKPSRDKYIYEYL